MYVYDLKHSVSISVLLYVEYYSDPWISSPVVSVKRLLGLMGRSLHLIPWFICACTHGYRHLCTPTGTKLLFCENDILNKGNALKFLYFILFWLQRRQGGSILSSLSTKNNGCSSLNWFQNPQIGYKSQFGKHWSVTPCNLTLWLFPFALNLSSRDTFSFKFPLKCYCFIEDCLYHPT